MGVATRRLRYRSSLGSKVSSAPKVTASSLSPSPNTREKVKVTKQAVMDT